MSGSALRVIVADDQPVVLAGLQAMLDAEPDIEVVGAAPDGEVAVELAAALRPDVVLMDIRMPRLDGIAAAQRITAARSADAVVMITTFDDEEYLLDSVRAGASGFLLKDAGPDLLSAAVRSAVRGDALIDPAMTRRLIERRLDAATTGSEASRVLTARLETLTDRERDVLAAIARGLSNAEMSTELYVSETTVKTHISRVLTKIGVRSRVAAAVFAYESGFVTPGGGRTIPG